jgi:hypothetical protein
MRIAAQAFGVAGPDLGEHALSRNAAGRISRHRIIPDARDDLNSLYDWIAGAASPGVALGYIERIERHLSGLS